ncbi:MAG: TetR family transcriptional regulator [Solirubrobacteraceae bacterium]
MQRSRLLAAAVVTMEELGYAEATVADITARARISRRTFYEMFDNCEDCLATVLDEALAGLRRELNGLNLDGLSWRERVRLGLSTILAFFDREPGLAQVCLVQSSQGSRRMLERRAPIFAELAEAIDQARQDNSRQADIPSLTAEGLVGAANAIVYQRVFEHSPEPLVALLPALMGMIVLPYLGQAAARREQARPVPEQSSTSNSRTSAFGGDSNEHDWLEALPMRLTYRTMRVLHAVAEHPGVSNRRAGEAAGIADQGQISKLLSRLERLGLLANTSEGHAKGEANAWRLTEVGQRFAHGIHVHASDFKQTA